MNETLVSEHPTGKDLFQFLMGQLDACQMRSIKTHLFRCPRCTARLDNPTDSDSLGRLPPSRKSRRQSHHLHTCTACSRKKRPSGCEYSEDSIVNGGKLTVHPWIRSAQRTWTGWYGHCLQSAPAQIEPACCFEDDSVIAVCGGRSR